jgi:hypothetical protein
MVLAGETLGCQSAEGTASVAAEGIVVVLAVERAVLVDDCTA